MSKSKQNVMRPKLDEFIRVKLGLQKNEFAELVKVSPATINKWIFTATLPNPHTLRCIAHDFGLSKDEVNDLFEVVQ